MNDDATAQTTKDGNQNTKPHPFQQGQLVFLDKHFFLQKEPKTSPKMEWSHRII
jgi:hypothetical protein